MSNNKKEDQVFKYAIALTGGIATGKSTVCKILKTQGFHIIDADKIAHDLLDSNSAQIALMFGDEFVENGKVLRKKLGKIIFANKKQRLKLENFIHPLIEKEIKIQAQIYDECEKPYFIDIPLFFESMKYDIAKSVLVYLPKKMQVHRLMQRDKIEQEEAMQKISNQMDIEKKKNLATFVVDNSKTLKELEKEIKKLKEKIA